MTVNPAPAGSGWRTPSRNAGLLSADCAEKAVWPARSSTNSSTRLSIVWGTDGPDPAAANAARARVGDSVGTALAAVDSVVTASLLVNSKFVKQGHSTSLRGAGQPWPGSRRGFRSRLDRPRWRAEARCRSGRGLPPRQTHRVGRVAD